jgi:hypothetical protein
MLWYKNVSILVAPADSSARDKTQYRNKYLRKKDKRKTNIRKQYATKKELLCLSKVLRWRVPTLYNPYHTIMVQNTHNGDINTGYTDNKMNSSELQKRFYMTYKAFFNAHDIVLSGNSILTWWADIAHGMSVLRIKQKLPLKIFCGVNHNNSGKVTFAKMSSYSILEDVFVDNDIHSFFRHDIDEITGFLGDFLSRHGYTRGVEISILFETPPGHGFAFSGVISVLLTFLTHILTDQIDIETLIEWEFPLDTAIFDQIYSSSLSLTHCIWGGQSVWWANNYLAMRSGLALPMIHFSQKCLHTDRHEDIIDIESHDIHRCVNTLIYQDTLLDFLWKDTTMIKELPIDYGVIFTGLEYRFADMEAGHELRKHREADLQSMITRIVSRLPIPMIDQVVLSDILSFDQGKILYRDIDHSNLQILQGFDTLFQAAHPERAVDGFIDTIRQVGLSSFAYQWENKLYTALKYLFHTYQQFEEESIGILPFNTGKIGGSLFFVMKKWKSRSTIEKVLTQLQQEWHIVSLDHASWRDGYASDGIRVEQYITRGIYSDYTHAGDVHFSDSAGWSYSGDYDMMIKNETNGILLDTIWRRIYLMGTKLTSKDVHSQNTTIDMMRLLLSNIGKEVPNSKLPISTYSQNKNELLGKIIIPLKKITREYFWKEISLTCSGGITEYYLRLDRDESIRIGIIEKLQK